MTTFDEIRRNVRAFDDEKVEREISFGRPALNPNDDYTVLWLAALIAVRDEREENRR